MLSASLAVLLRRLDLLPLPLPLTNAALLAGVGAIWDFRMADGFGLLRFVDSNPFFLLWRFRFKTNTSTESYGSACR